MSSEGSTVEHSEEADVHRNGDIPRISFLSRLRHYPLFRDATNYLQTKYQDTKEKNGLLKNVLERGETTVVYSWNRANQLAEKTGVRAILEKPVIFMDSKAVQILDSVEKKFPIVHQTQYEIKLTVRDKVDSTRGQFLAVREQIKSRADDALKTVKAAGEKQINTVTGTITQKLDGIFSQADTLVDKVLPETNGHAHMNGNGAMTNGYVSKMNGYRRGSLDHAKCLTTKVVRRVTVRMNSKSQDVVDAVKRNSLITSGKDAFFAVEQRTKMYQGNLAKTYEGYKLLLKHIYLNAVETATGGIRAALALSGKILPLSVNQKLFAYCDTLIARIPKVQQNGKAH